jgi:cytoskeletal protein CcmA (bactofilin family)
MSETMQNVRRTASQSVTLLKTAAFGAGKTPPMPETANESSATPARPDKTVLSASTQLTGSITTTDELHIRGKIDGNVSASGITVLSGGVVKGDLTAETIVIHGSVEGRIEAAHVRLYEGSLVKGEIIHGSLGIDTAAEFEGSIKRIAAAVTSA